MKLLFVIDEGFDIEFLTFSNFIDNLNRINFINFDFLLIEENSNEIEKLRDIQKLSFIFKTIYIQKTFTSNDILEKINNYKDEYSSFLFDDYKMILKGKLLKPLEHQWKQPLNLIATNLLNLEIKSELSKLTKEDVDKTNEKIEYALSKVSKSLSNMNNVFSNSSEKSEFIIDDCFEKILEFIYPQMQKHNISLKKSDSLKSQTFYSFENEFCLLLLNIIYIFVQDLIEIQTNNKKFEISMSCEENKIKISLNKELSQLDLIKKYSFEFLVVKYLINKLSLPYEMIWDKERTIVELICK